MQAFAIALVTWTLLEKGKQKKLTTLLEFTLKSFAISFAAS